VPPPGTDGSWPKLLRPVRRRAYADVMSLLQRLDEVDRWLRLHPSVESEQHAARWWRVYLVAAIASTIIGVALYIAGQSAYANLMIGLPGVCGLVALQGWSVNRRAQRRHDREPTISGEGR
jgi:hypothetical protein